MRKLYSSSIRFPPRLIRGSIRNHSPAINKEGHETNATRRDTTRHMISLELDIYAVSLLDAYEA